MPYRLIVSDMDDTLLNEHGILSPVTLQAVAAVRRAGAGFVLASGRMPCAMRSYARQLNLNLPMITYNGAELVEPVSGKPLFRLPIETELSLELIRYCEERGIHIQAYQGDCFLTPSDNEQARRYHASLHGLAQMCVTERPLSECVTWAQSKLLAILDPAQTPAVLTEVKKHFNGRIVCAMSRPQYIEFTSPLAGKERALAELCQRMNIPSDEVIAFGDGQNDVGMIRFAGLGCAMANARDEVRRQADFIAPSHREDGVAQVIMRLIEQKKIGKGM